MQGAQLLGPIRASRQMTQFSGGIGADGGMRGRVEALIDFLPGPEAGSTFKANGLSREAREAWVGSPCQIGAHEAGTDHACLKAAAGPPALVSA